MGRRCFIIHVSVHPNMCHFKFINYTKRNFVWMYSNYTLQHIFNTISTPKASWVTYMTYTIVEYMAPLHAFPTPQNRLYQYIGLGVVRSSQWSGITMIVISTRNWSWYAKLTNRSRENLIITRVFLVSSLNCKPCHISLNFRCPIKESDHVYCPHTSEEWLYWKGNHLKPAYLSVTYKARGGGGGGLFIACMN